MAMHNLTTFCKPPPNLKCLLGLNLKFIPRPRFTTTDLDETKQRFCQQVYLQDYYLNNPRDTREDKDTSSHNPKLHIPTHWIPAIWKLSEKTVLKTNDFLSCVDRLFQQRQCSPNLSTSQLNLLKLLSKKDKFIITKADKNLGPYILETEKYIDYALRDHLNCKTTYKKLSNTSAITHMDSVKK